VTFLKYYEPINNIGSSLIEKQMDFINNRVDFHFILSIQFFDYEIFCFSIIAINSAKLILQNFDAN